MSSSKPQSPFWGRTINGEDFDSNRHEKLREPTAIRAEGGVLRDAVALFDRKEGENEKLAEHEVSPYSLLTAGEAVDKLYPIGAITEDQL
jgi:hypothetical protein